MWNNPATGVNEPVVWNDGSPHQFIRGSLEQDPPIVHTKCQEAVDNSLDEGQCSSGFQNNANEDDVQWDWDSQGRMCLECMDTYAAERESQQ